MMKLVSNIVWPSLFVLVAVSIGVGLFFIQQSEPAIPISTDTTDVQALTKYWREDIEKNGARMAYEHFKEEYKGIHRMIWQYSQELHDNIATLESRENILRKVRELISAINSYDHPGEPITDLGLKFPEVAVN